MNQLSVSTARSPKVSVIVKAYNHARYVRRTIESVLEQSFEDFEIVVTDDGSTDETPDALAEFSDPRLHVQASLENQGISLAMNATIARARGRYLAILNSDDWALPNRLQRQVDFLDANPDVSVLCGLPQVVDEEGIELAPGSNWMAVFGAPQEFPDFSRRTWLRHFFFNGNCLCAPTAMIRREAYQSAGVYDPRFTNAQDFDMWTRMLIAGHQIHWSPEEYTAYRVRAGNLNMSANRPDTTLREAFEIANLLRHFLKLSAHDFEEIFGDEAVRTSGPSAPVWLRMAELALENTWAPYRNFALRTYFENAKELQHFRRLAHLSGTIDAWNLLNGEPAYDSADEAVDVGSSPTVAI